MKTIFKWPLQPGRNEVPMPAEARALTVQVQGDFLCLCVLIDPAHFDERRVFYVYGTGHPLARDPGEYVATVQMHGGALVWHVFDATHSTP